MSAQKDRCLQEKTEGEEGGISFTGEVEEEEGKEEEDEVWKGVWRKGTEVENSVHWGGEEEPSLWRRRQGEKNQVSFIS